MCRRSPGFYLCPPPPVHLTSLILSFPPRRPAPGLLHNLPLPASRFILVPPQAVSTRLGGFFLLLLLLRSFPPAATGMCFASSAQHKHVGARACARAQQHGRGRWHVTGKTAGGSLFTCIFIYESEAESQQRQECVFSSRKGERAVQSRRRQMVGGGDCSVI